MITLKEYLMGRDKEFPLDMQMAINAAKLLASVNWVLGRLNIHTTVSSGYRPSSINKTIGGAKMSTHTVCAGIDLRDPSGSLAKTLVQNLSLLAEAGLWMEDPSYTKGWVHLDIKERKNRVFIP